MPGVYQLEIKETLDELRKLLRVQKTASDKERIQLLYLLKSEQAQTITIAASLLGRHRVTVQKWRASISNRWNRFSINPQTTYRKKTKYSSIGAINFGKETQTRAGL